MLTDQHNHTKTFSPDAEMSIDELTAAAVARGLSRVAVTEHYEIDYPHDEDPPFLFDLDEYSKTFASWKTSSPLPLLMGIEFGYQTHTAEQIESVAQALPFDVVILSNHLFRGCDVYYSKTCYDVPQKERHAEYIGVMAQMCEKIDTFDIAAHYDYINRYNPDRDARVLYDDCPDEFDRMFEALISKEKALEINTRSIDKLIKRGASNPMPDSKLLMRYRDMGGRLITLGSDSHTCDTLGIHFEETCEYLKGLGFTEAVYFVNHKPFTEPL